MDLGLEGKTVIVTGASGVIGRGLVQRFAEEGSNVVLATRDGAKGNEIAALYSGKTGEAVCIPTDVTSPESVESMVVDREDIRGCRLGGQPEYLGRLPLHACGRG